MRKQLLLLILLLVTTEMSYSQNNGFAAETMAIHTNSKTFVTGETLLYKVYCFENEVNKLSTISKFAYIEIFNSKGESVVRNKIALTNGISNNEIFITTSFETGKYRLVGYTTWMQNNDNGKYFETELTIINPFQPFVNKEKRVSFVNKVQQDGPDFEKNISLSLNKKTIAAREKITLEIDNTSFKSLNGNFSLSVRKVDSLNFSNSNKLKSRNSDGKVSQINFLPELRGELLTGKIVTESSYKPLQNNSVGLSLMGERFDVKITKTNANGEFNFILDEAVVKEQAYIQVMDDFSNDFQIVIDKPTSVVVKTQTQGEEIYINPNFIPQIEERLVSCQIVNNYLAPVPVAKDAAFVPFYDPNQIEYILDDYKRFPSFKETIVELLPSVYFKQEAGVYSLHIRDFISAGDSYGKALVLVDGLMIQNVNDLFNYNTKNIYKISIVNKPYSYGSKLFSGIISVITFNKNYSLIPKEITPITVERFIPAPEYASINYTNDDSLKRIPDYRYQLMWNPNLIIENQKTTIDFYSSDIKGDFEITLEGFLDNGKQVFLKEFFSVK